MVACNLFMTSGVPSMMRGMSLEVRAELAREHARRAREVAAQLSCPQVSARLESCALAWEMDADMFEAVTTRRTSTPVYWNELNRLIL
jgi:molybdopterin-biosynthesis enzyme MoeA-like protein